MATVLIVELNGEMLCCPNRAARRAAASCILELIRNTGMGQAYTRVPDAYN